MFSLLYTPSLLQSYGVQAPLHSSELRRAGMLSKELRSADIIQLQYSASMKVILQRVTEASVTVDGSQVGSIGQGYLLLLGVLQGDTSAQAELLADKIVKLRLFDADDGKINDQSILDIGGSILVVSQFTLAGRVEKGNRPDYTQAAPPDEAEKLYVYFIGKLKELGVQRVESGRFGAMMEVGLKNDGPVTLTIER